LAVPWQAGQVIVGLASVACFMIILYESGSRTSSEIANLFRALTSRAAFV